MSTKPSLVHTLKWAYGVTTVSSRILTYLGPTLKSLAAAGFDQPRLFIDGTSRDDLTHWMKLPRTFRDPAVRTSGSWYLALTELYVRTPDADRYVIFQDDILACRNLKAYMERQPYQDKRYYNLYTFPQNQALCPSRDHQGWYESNQKGKGAQALLFNRKTVQDLLSSPYFVDRFGNTQTGWKSVDGAICMSLKNYGYREYVHNPSLVEHVGDQSSIANELKHHSLSFPGEAFDCLTLLTRENS